jgi:hypothetical protein
VLAGCRQGRETVSLDRVQLRDLRAMVVPRDGLGTPAIGLAVNRSSGWKRNRAAARETPDADDTGRSLARSGRLGGYELTYSHPRGLAWRYEDRPLFVATEVELYRDEPTASANLRGGVELTMRSRGRKLPDGGRLALVERFDAGDVGDEAAGVRSAVRIGDGAVYLSTVVFRRGRLLASATVAHRAEIGSTAVLQEIAGTLDDRITGVGSGALTKAAVKLPGHKR